MRSNPSSKLVLAALAIAATAMAVPALSLGADAKRVFLEAKLKGQDEVPGPGDPNGRGNFDGKFKWKKGKKNGKICFDLAFRGLSSANAGHIHKGGEDVAGPIKVELFATNLSGEAAIDDCVKERRRKVKRIARNPEKYYVNVHNEEYPDGAIRGQLEKEPTG